MSNPTTDAGRALARMTNDDLFALEGQEWCDAIIAIEDEARAALAAELRVALERRGWYVARAEDAGWVESFEWVPAVLEGLPVKVSGGKAR